MSPAHEDIDPRHEAGPARKRLRTQGITTEVGYILWATERPAAELPCGSFFPRATWYFQIQSKLARMATHIAHAHTTKPLGNSTGLLISALWVFILVFLLPPSMIYVLLDLLGLRGSFPLGWKRRIRRPNSGLTFLAFVVSSLSVLKLAWKCFSAR